MQLTVKYPLMLIYSHEVKHMGETAGDSVQECMADVEVGAVTYACRTVADRDGDSASSILCC